MKRTTSIILLLVMTFSCFSQNDWFGFNRYKADNERIIKNGEFPEVVFMGNSITENWAYFHPDFFCGHNYCGRGIGGQTSAQMLMRFTADVIDLHPKAVVIMSGTNDVAHNTYWVEPSKVVDTIVDINKQLRAYAEANGIVYVDYHVALADKHDGFTKELSDDGCHPNPDTYFIMEELVLKAIHEAVR